MKISVFLSMILLSLAYSNEMHGQDARVSLDVKNQTVSAVLEKIENQSNYFFFYNNREVDVNRIISVDVDNKQLRDVLDVMFEDSNIKYSVLENSIILSNREVLMPAKAQGIAITGTVTDAEDNPLPGASVVINGTSQGTVTNVNGVYSLTVPNEDAVLVISFVGFATQEIAVGNQRVINVRMSEDAHAIEEVVVTALGIRRSERALSYNVQTVSSEDVTAVKSANFINALSGKVAGVNINAGSSGMGGASKVVMRGTKSIEQSNNALYVIDGIPMFNTKGAGDSGAFGSGGTTEAIADLNPEDIASVSVLTGPAAAALYGNQGANGAIVITTKQGTAGKVEVNFSSTAEAFNPFVLPRFQNRYGTGDISTAGGSSIKSWGHPLLPENNYGFDPKKDFFETGTAFTNALSVSSGTERNRTYVSAAVLNTDGIVPNTQYDRYNFTFRNTGKFFGDQMTLDVGGSYIIQKDQNMRNQGVYSNPAASAYLFPRGDDFDMVRVFERFDPVRNIAVQYWPQGEGDFRLQNPYWIAYRNLRNNDKTRYMFHANLGYDILDWLNVTGRVRIDNSDNDHTQKSYATTNAVFAGPNGSYSIGRSQDRQTYADVLVNIHKDFGDISLRVNAGASRADVKWDNLDAGGPIREDGIPNVFNVFQIDKEKGTRSQDGWRELTQAVFASAEIGYQNAYYLTLTGRNDWESTLSHTEHLSFFYPSVGLSAVLSEILPLPRQISYLKLRGSFAQVGNKIPRFISNPTYSWNNETGAWSTETIYPIRVFKPESTTSWELGLTAHFLQQFRFDFTWYQSNTFNQTFQPQLSVSSGYSTIYMQTGNVSNRGIETRLNYSNRWSDLSWSSTVIFSLNRNKIEELVHNQPHPETGEIINKDRLDVGGLGRAGFILKPGGSLGDLYTTTDLRRDSKGYVYVDANGDLSVNHNVSDIYLGSVFPKSNVSWRNDLSWKNIHVNFLLAARFGGAAFSATQAALDFYGVSEASADARDRGYVIINGEDRIDPQTWYTTIGAQNGVPQYYTYSATNVRLQEFGIGYTIPKSKLYNTVDLTISLVGRNLWMICNKAPFDPESVASTGNYYQGMDNFIMPSLRSFGLNLNVKF